MSWSFSVIGKDESEAFGKFQEELWKNGANVPFAMGDEINKAAASLSQASLDARASRVRSSAEPVRRICLASAGHFNPEGEGNVSVTMHVMPPEPPKAMDDDQNGQ